MIMRWIFRGLILFAGWSLQVLAQTQYCSSTGICMALAVPSASMDVSSMNDIFITIQAPGSEGWFSIGFGSKMSHSLMLVAWPYSGQIIVSPRLGSGHSMPLLYSDVVIQVLASNITKDSVTVQLKCSNCTSWSGGRLDIASQSADFMWASAPNGPMNSSDISSVFPKHKDYGIFKMNMTTARMSSSLFPPTVNPNLANPANSAGGLTMRQTVIIAHGVIAGVVFLVLFPLGTVIIKFIGDRVSRPIRKHWLLQSASVVLLLVSGGLGIFLAIGHQFYTFRNLPNAVQSSNLSDDSFGLAVILVCLFQGLVGWYHHRRYVKDKPDHRRWFTYLHIWLGRLVIIGGLINCGFGFPLANIRMEWAILWWGVSGVVVIVYVLSFIWFEWFRNSRGEGRIELDGRRGHELGRFSNSS